MRAFLLGYSIGPILRVALIRPRKYHSRIRAVAGEDTATGFAFCIEWNATRSQFQRFQTLDNVGLVLGADVEVGEGESAQCILIRAEQFGEFVEAR